MPEQITKYPDITLQILREAGAVCGKGAPQKILKQCPADRFCSLPTGEMCIYGIKDIPRMTQIAPAELAQVVCPLTPKGASFAAGFSGLEAAMIFWAVSRLEKSGGRALSALPFTSSRVPTFNAGARSGSSSQLHKVLSVPSLTMKMRSR